MDVIFWDRFEPAVLTFCEQELRGWIKQPANTWSNLAYVAVGLWVIFREKPAKDGLVRLIGPIAIMIGLTSGLYHASMVFWTEAMDLGSMYLLSTFFMIFNLRRLRAIKPAFEVPFYVLLNVASLALLLITRRFGIYIFAAEMVVFGILEARLLMVERPRPSYRYWLIGVGSFAVSYVFWNLDFHRIVCDPDNHVLQGHAAWHVTNSLVFLCAHRFCKQFEKR